jgi:hypothetical protein
VRPADGFWLPANVRDEVLSPGTQYVTPSFADGRPSGPSDEGAVTVRWPQLHSGQWSRLVDGLRANREQAPRGQAFWERLQAALDPASRLLSNPAEPLHRLALSTLPGYTGYSEAMIRLTLGALDLWTLDQFAAALELAPALEAMAGWQPMPGLPGRLRFYGDSRWQSLQRRLPGRRKQPLFGVAQVPELVVGYGAGNVPGSALLISFLALATALAGTPPPVTIVRNSRREPIFAPLVLRALEQIDPDLVSSVALLVWDHADATVEANLLPQAELAIAAAGDDAIAQIHSALRRAAGPSARFHAHGHKVSFSAIGREVLARGLQAGPDGPPLLDVVCLLAALDSAFWDQHGCLSSRMHFVQDGGEGYERPVDYARRLADQLGLLAAYLPRGNWPRSWLRDRFDRYKLLEQTGRVQVLSAYDDEFVVVLDERAPDAASFGAQVNDCQGRVIIVRPVRDLMAVPEQYLASLPAANLQSLSVALGQPGEGLTSRTLRFAEACGARGVTAIRTVGRGAFPQLAYSWDGLIPLDLVRTRPSGYFATIEFDRPYDEILDTYRQRLQWSTALGHDLP